MTLVWTPFPRYCDAVFSLHGNDQCSPLNRMDPVSASKSSRLILVDDNIRNVGGHFFELATLLMTGAESLGYQCVMATHDSFDSLSSVPRSWNVLPTFHTRRMVRWSLGVDGKSTQIRDFDGRPVGGSIIDRAKASALDWMNPPAKRPAKMVSQWADGFCNLMEKVRPTSSDSLLISTGDDFVLLALAAALKRSPIPPVRIDVIFHFALYETDTPNRRERLKLIGRQLQAAIKGMAPHRVHLHATTTALAAQLRETECGTSVNAISYPTRQRQIDTPSIHFPVKAVLAGLPRAEKGRDAISELITGIEKTLLKSGRTRLSMQMPAQNWETMIPSSLHRSYRNAIANPDLKGPLEIMTSNLSTTDYHQWLDTADLGLFLYEPRRYVARCSGVLLEMLARGIPVIVPDRCWLADQVRLAGGHRSIGFIYQDRSEIPELMRQFVKRRTEIQGRSIAHARVIANRHNGRNTLQEMGLAAQQEQRAA